MSSQVDILNEAAIMLGQAPLNGIADTGKVARAFNAVWGASRDYELRVNVWKFAKVRTTLAALASVPASGPYTQQFQLPAQFIRELMVGDFYPAADLTDYRSQPENDNYSIENGLLLCNQPAPLPFVFTERVTDTTLWDAGFCTMTACRIAKKTCFAVTNSISLLQAVNAEYITARKESLRTGALETPPQTMPDDTWIMARMGDGGAAPNTRNQ